MKLLELTDGLAEQNPQKEYVDADSIARIEQYTYEEEIYEKKQVTSGFLFWQSTEEEDGYVRTEERIGSLIYLKGKGKTFVREAPETIISMIKDKQFVVEA